MNIGDSFENRDIVTMEKASIAIYGIRSVVIPKHLQDILNRLGPASLLHPNPDLVFTGTEFSVPDKIVNMVLYDR